MFSIGGYDKKKKGEEAFVQKAFIFLHIDYHFLEPDSQEQLSDVITHLQRKILPLP